VVFDIVRNAAILPVCSTLRRPELNHSPGVCFLPALLWVIGEGNKAQLGSLP
jgi:hypothetical protein